MAKMKGRRRRLAAAHAAARAEQATTPERYGSQRTNKRCMTCNRIFAGPHAGEVVPLDSPDYRRIGEEDRHLGVSNTITDGTCNRRSCIEAHIRETMAGFRARYPDKDLSELEALQRRTIEDDVRRRTEDFPEGLIEDAETAAPAEAVAHE